MRRTIFALAVGLFAGLPAWADWTPDIEAWNSPQPPQPEAVLIRNATIWTGGEAGILENADLLVRNGRIAAVGQDLNAPRNAMEIDAEGKHVTPGIIDAHSHAAIIGGVNEGSRINTGDVRIRDVIDAESINIYRQLAGGVTAINLLHGSANAIGGQMAVIKMRWGAAPSDLIFEAAPEGIKFALGENPKQSNWSADTPRYPQTRLGVEQVIRELFEQAADYRDAHENHPSGRAGRERVPPRPNHQLAAVAEVIHGERHVHSHTYRADETLALMRIAEQFDFTIQAFHHALEGYKIGPELAKHGASASVFIDWWAFKYEAIDGIGYNPALMHQAGTLTGLHSDNAELARRMNLEAAKAVRYGGVDPHVALQMVTAFPADQLGIAHRTGRLEEGLDADFVIWSGHPLSVYTRAEQTWVDGRRYFDLEADQRMQAALAEEHAELFALALDSDEPANSNDAAHGEEDDRSQRRRVASFATHLTGYRASELDHDEFCLLHDH